jgi:hypothetical protein
MSDGFEWTFSTRVRERSCSSCRSKTSGYLTNFRTGVRRSLCSRCFLSLSKQPAGVTAPLRKRPSFAPNPQPSHHREEQLRLC